MTDHPQEAGSTSQTVSNQHVPIINIATNQAVGSVSSEYLHTRARIGLVFLYDERKWKILHITEEETILLLPAKKLTNHAQNGNTGPLKETHEAKLKKTSANSSLGLPSPTDELIVLESYQSYIIIHTLLGARINTTLRLVFDAMLTEQDLVRDTYNDSVRILIRTPIKLTRDEIESIAHDLFHIASSEFDRLLNEAIEARFPYVSPKRDQAQAKSQLKKTLSGDFEAKLVIRQSKEFFRRLAEGRIKTLIHYSIYRPTPPAKEIIDEYSRTSAEESDALIKGNLKDLKHSIEKETAHLLCLNCLSLQAPNRISHIAERPKCIKCDSSLLGLPVIPVQTAQALLRKKKSMKLSQAETEQFAGIRRTADLVLSYGKRAVIALSVTGIGPQTASSILASMPTNDSELYYDLLRARIHYLTTRELWDRNQK